MIFAPEHFYAISMEIIEVSPFIKRIVRQPRLVVVVLPLEEEGDTVAVGGIPVVHLLEYLTIQIKPATPNLLTLGVVHFETCFSPLGLLRPRTLP